jgi:hypothetical protein
VLLRLPQRIVRPGRTTLRDVMNRAREIALQSVYTTLSCGLSEDQEEQIEALLIVTPAPSESEQREQHLDPVLGWNSSKQYHEKNLLKRCSHSSTG